jgi:hypothetical protein
MHRISQALNRFLKYMITGPIILVSIIPSTFGFLTLFFLGWCKEQFFPTLPRSYNFLILMIFFVIVGSTGIFYIVRKEMPGPLSSMVIRGKPAIIGGISLVLFFWGLGIFLFVSALIK